MKRRVSFINIRALPDERLKNKVKAPFQNLVKQRGIQGESSMSMVGGELFALMERGRPMGGAWIRTWPTHPNWGDAHVAGSKFRFRDYDTIVALDMLLISREKIMSLKKWRMMASVEDDHVIRALKYIRFTEVARQSFPGMGEMVILDREVI